MGDCQLRFLFTSNTLTSEDALRLVTVADELVNIDARARSDWATFFRQGSVARHAELRRHGWRERRS